MHNERWQPTELEPIPPSRPNAPRRPLAFRSIGVSTGVRPFSLLVDQGGDELTAEGWDLRDHRRRVGRLWHTLLHTV